MFRQLGNQAYVNERIFIMISNKEVFSFIVHNQVYHEDTCQLHTLKNFNTKAMIKINKYNKEGY